MTTAKNGGPAFPVPNLEHDEDFNGMSLRDWFAGKALPGVIGAIMVNECHNWRASDFAKEAYEMADAMLAERAK